MWDIAPKMITGLMNIETEIYTVVKSGTSSIFSSSFDPKYTTSSRNLEKALTKHWGYSKTPKQGKGSHVKYQRQSSLDINDCFIRHPTGPANERYKRRD